MSEADKNKPLLSIPPDQIVFTALGVTLREAVANKVLTQEALDAISKRAEEVAMAIMAGKMVVVTKEGQITIRELDEDDWAEVEKRKGEFPITRTAKKTLDV